MTTSNISCKAGQLKNLSSPGHGYFSELTNSGDVASDKDKDNEDEEGEKDDRDDEDGEDSENEEDEEDRGSSDVNSNQQLQHGFGTYLSIIAENSWLKL